MAASPFHPHPGTLGLGAWESCSPPGWRQHCDCGSEVRRGATFWAWSPRAAATAPAGASVLAGALGARRPHAPLAVGRVQCLPMNPAFSVRQRHRLPRGFGSPPAGKGSVLLRAPVVALGLPVSPRGSHPVQPGGRGVDTVDGSTRHALSDSGSQPGGCAAVTPQLTLSPSGPPLPRASLFVALLALGAGLQSLS